MGFFSRLFGGDGGGNAAPKIEATETIEGVLVEATPMPEGGQFRLAARLSKEIDGTVREHQLIRADLFQSREEAARMAITKARQVIAEQGDRLFTH